MNVILSIPHKAARKILNLISIGVYGFSFAFLLDFLTIKIKACLFSSKSWSLQQRENKEQ